MFRAVYLGYDSVVNVKERYSNGFHVNRIGVPTFRIKLGAIVERKYVGNPESRRCQLPSEKRM